jgi:hypothetical protein
VGPVAPGNPAITTADKATGSVSSLNNTENGIGSLMRMTQKKVEAIFAAWKARAFPLLEIKPVYADMAKEYAKQEMLHRNGDGRWHSKT